MQQCNQVPVAENGDDASRCSAPSDRHKFLEVVKKENYDKLAAFWRKHTGLWQDIHER